MRESDHSDIYSRHKTFCNEYITAGYQMTLNNYNKFTISLSGPIRSGYVKECPIRFMTIDHFRTMLVICGTLVSRHSSSDAAR